MDNLKRIVLIISGLPDDNSVRALSHVRNIGMFKVLKYSMSGWAGAVQGEFKTSYNLRINLLKPNKERNKLKRVIKRYGKKGFIVIALDFSSGPDFADNLLTYCFLEIPFIRGTAYEDYEYLSNNVASSGTCAVFAPSLLDQIIAFHDLGAIVKDNGYPKRNLTTLYESDTAILINFLASNFRPGHVYPAEGLRPGHACS